MIKSDNVRAAEDHIGAFMTKIWDLVDEIDESELDDGELMLACMGAAGWAAVENDMPLKTFLEIAKRTFVTAMEAKNLEDKGLL